MSDFSTIWLNKNDQKQTSSSFSILFSVMGNLEIVMGSLDIFSDFCSALSRNCPKEIDQMYKVLFPITS